jgi:hypothetical protein
MYSPSLVKLVFDLLIVETLWVGFVFSQAPLDSVL